MQVAPPLLPPTPKLHLSANSANWRKTDPSAEQENTKGRYYTFSAYRLGNVETKPFLDKKGPFYWGI
jgi:hypothetical protein